ncbi:MAG: hypothetical protein ACRDNK_20980 [Solirubrobacteraceae bacterium]
MLTPPQRLLSVVGLSGALLAGCGSSSGLSSDASHAANTLTRAFHALATGDGATVCSLATAAGQQSLASAVPGSTCRKVVVLVSAHLTSQQKAALGSVQVKTVAVKGNLATVRAQDISSKQGSFKGFLNAKSASTRLSKQADGTWRIAR